jgi:regulator of protease activity HflC (stomatin/prohibitin superfamily)
MNTWFPGFYTVPQGHVAIVERFGKYVRTLQPGLNWINPFTDTIKNLGEWTKTDPKGNTASKYDRLIETTEQLWNIPEIECFTKDHVNVAATSTIHFRIAETSDYRAAKRAVYAVDVFPNSLKDLIQKALRSQISNVDFSNINPYCQKISQNIMKMIAAKVHRWGVKLLSVEVGELKFDPQLTEVLRQKRLAEAEKDRVEVETVTSRMKAQAEAEVTKIKTIAEVNQNKIMNQTEIEYIEQLKDRIGIKGAVEFLVAEKGADGLAKIAASSNSKMIVVPTDFKGMLKLGHDKP